MNAFWLKIIALVSMLVDHASIVLGNPAGWGRVIGRLAFPIYVFLVAEGFRHTRSAWKFTARLAAFALISEPFFDLALHNEGINFLARTNIFYTLALAGVAIAAGKHKLILAVPAAIAAMAAAHFLTSDYAAHGVAFILAMYYIEPIKPRLAVAALFALHQHIGIFELLWEGHGAFLRWEHYALIPATLAAVALLYFYNGKRGISLKWAFYAAYPLHLALLALVG
jgi:hypothetical protein